MKRELCPVRGGSALWLRAVLLGGFVRLIRQLAPHPEPGTHESVCRINAHEQSEGESEGDGEAIVHEPV